VEVAVATVVPSYVIVNAELGRKLEPDTVTVVPTDPLEGFRETVGLVIV
jgi:hypothetical protein